MKIKPEQLACTRPFDGGWVDECSKIYRAAAERAINALDPDIRSRVSNACSECGLSAESTWHVLGTTCDLIHFHHVGRHAVLTTAQSFDALAEIQELASALADALDELPIMEKIGLDSEVRKAHEQLGELDRLRMEHNGRPNALGIRVLSQGARMMLERRVADEGKGGRRRILAEYARHLGSLANTFDEAGLSVGRGGIFERLCEVVFEVAGVPAKPEGAIRLMLQERKKFNAGEGEETKVGKRRNIPGENTGQ